MSNGNSKDNKNNDNINNKEQYIERWASQECVYTSQNIVSATNPLSQSTCHKPFGCPSHPRMISCLSSKTLIPFLFAKVWNSFFEKLRCDGSSTPASNKAFISSFFDLSTRLLRHVARSLRCAILCLFERYHGHASSGLNTMNWVSPHLNFGKWGPRNPFVFVVIESLIIDCAPQ